MTMDSSHRAMRHVRLAVLAMAWTMLLMAATALFGVLPVAIYAAYGLFTLLLIGRGITMLWEDLLS